MSVSSRLSALSHTRSIRAGALAACLLATPASGAAQHTAHVHDEPAAKDAPVRPADPAAEAATASMGHEGAMPAPMRAHMRMSPRRPATRADSARAAAIVATLREALGKYRDVRVAEAEGFRMFAPKLKNQRVYHFTHSGKAFREVFRFDPAQPTSLLYRKDANGAFILLGAMYVAPKRSSFDDLNERVPLSVAQWHAHTNVCVPPPRQRERWREMRDGQMLFGPAGVIATKADCSAAGGRFHEQLFGWMVHANVFASDDPAKIWGEEHGDEHKH